MKIKYQHKNIIIKLINKLRFIFCIFLVVLAIEFFLYELNVKSYLFPRPSEIIKEIIENPLDFYVAWRVTILESLTGLFFAFLASTLVCFIIILHRCLYTFFNTIGVIIQSTPILAIAPILNLWFGQSFSSKAITAGIVCFFPLLTGWLAGIKSTNLDQIELFENINASKWATIKYLLFPNSLPYLFGGLRVALPLSLLGAIVGEFVGASEGIGFRILNNSYYLRTAAMFGYILIVSLTGLGLTMLVSIVEKKIVFWHGESRKVR